MNRKQKIIFIGIVVCLFAWVVSSIYAYYSFYNGTYTDLMIADNMRKTIYLKILLTIIIYTFGVILSKEYESRKRSEREFVERLNFFTLIFKSIGDGVIIFNQKKHNISYINDTAEKFTGWKKSEVIGRSIESILKITDIKTRSHTGECNLITKSEENKHIRYNYFSVMNNGAGAEEIVIIFQDITKQKTTEFSLEKKQKELSSLLRSVKEGIIIFDENKKIEMINEVMEKLLDIKKEDYIDCSLKDIFRILNINYKTYQPVIEKVLKNREPMNFPFENLIINEKNIKVEASGLPLINIDNKIIGGILIIEDITERKKLQEEQLINRKFESLTLLARGIAHDFNNFLAGIVNNVSILKTKFEGNNEILNTLNNIENIAFKGRDLTNQLSTFSKSNLPIKVPVAFKKFVKDIVKTALSRTNIKPIGKFPKDELLIDIDPSQIRQAINNISINAVQAMPAGGEIKVTLKEVKLMADNIFHLASGNYAKLSIQDFGEGIAVENINKIFDPYYTTKENCQGIGLATSFSIIKQHAGAIVCASELKIGTTVIIYLPITLSWQEKNISEEGTGIIKGTGNILLMDDEEFIRDTAKKIIEYLGYNVTLAKNGTEAMALYSVNFDLVILDLNISDGMGGKETAKAILNINPKAKIIVSSGFVNDIVITNYEDFGFCGKMNKPYTINELSAIIHKFIKVEKNES
jgi:PAS domain S-box-containing protein